MNYFDSLLIANRGEIACRIIRTAKRLGYRTIAVFSQVDRDSPHVRMADHALCIGEAPASDSYLNINSIIDAAKRSGAQAIHPGYGFLSENAEFARACAVAGIVFIGPSAQAIEAMGDKAQAKRRIASAGVPLLPGYLGEDQSDACFIEQAHAIGFPLLVKALAGGGGRGIRQVRSADELLPALSAARRESQAAFGDDRLMLEKLIDQGRHIEIQIFGDGHGNAVHLGERDCTAQRRRQKVIEETPSPVVSPAMQEAMGRDAVTAAKAIGYCGAGTIEFIVDSQLQHYFLEMNTRLQVEHPVTECVTGLDLVEWQLRVASGEPLPLQQSDITFKGHAIEARLYAEDPYRNFAPQSGRIIHWRPAQSDADAVRIDSGVEENGEISPHYDPMIAKLIVHGRDRADAIRRLTYALSNTPLLGIRHNARFLQDLINHRDFVNANMHTMLMDHWLDNDDPIIVAPTVSSTAWAIAAAIYSQGHNSSLRPPSLRNFDLILQCGDLKKTFRIEGGSDEVTVADTQSTTHRIAILSKQDRFLRIVCNDQHYNIVAVKDNDLLHLAIDGDAFVFIEHDPTRRVMQPAASGQLSAPITGRVAQIAVAIGDQVQAGQQLLCMEAMKMEIWLRADISGRVHALHATTGQQMQANVLIIEINPQSADQTHG